MPLKYEYDLEFNIVDTYPYGDHTISDIHDHFEELEGDKIKRGFVNVVHFENINKYLFSSNEASVITRSFRRLKDKKDVRAIVFVADLDINYGMARMMQNFHNIDDPTSDVFVVRTKYEADNIIKNIIGQPLYSASAS